MESLGDRIRKAREAKGLSQKAVADHFGIQRVSVTQWESNETHPRPERFPELARFLGVSADWLISNQGAPPGRPARQGHRFPEKNFQKLSEADQEYVAGLIDRLARQPSE